MIKPLTDAEYLKLCDRLMVEVYDPTDAEWKVADELHRRLSASTGETKRESARVLDQDDLDALLGPEPVEATPPEPERVLPREFTDQVRQHMQVIVSAADNLRQGCSESYDPLCKHIDALNALISERFGSRIAGRGK